MEFRKMVTITLYARQQKRHWCIEQSYGLCGRGRGWEDLGEWHWNMWNVMYETRCQSRFNARWTDAEAETPVLWLPHAKSWLIGKDSDAGRDWRQKKKGTTEDEMAGWHHLFDAWVWVNSRSWWCTGRPDTLWFMGSQRVRHDWATELNWVHILNTHTHRHMIK